MCSCVSDEGVEGGSVAAGAANESLACGSI